VNSSAQAGVIATATSRIKSKPAKRFIIFAPRIRRLRLMSTFLACPLVLEMVPQFEHWCFGWRFRRFIRVGCFLRIKNVSRVFISNIRSSCISSLTGRRRHMSFVHINSLRPSTAFARLCIAAAFVRLAEIQSFQLIFHFTSICTPTVGGFV